MTMVAAVQFRSGSLIRPNSTLPSSLCFRRLRVASHLSKLSSVRRCRQSWRPLCSPQCAHKNGEDKAESPESLFQKELNRRGINSSSLDTADDRQGEPSSSREASPPPQFADKNMSGGQLERSRKLNSEGLEGLIPRATSLAQLGGSFFLAFLPAVLVISLLFSAIYFVYGQDFIHGGDHLRSAPPPYLDPFDLLDAPTVDPMVPLRR